MKRTAVLVLTCALLAPLGVGRAVADDLPRVGSDRSVPWQLLAKLSTEALGESPDQTRWAEDVAFFRAEGCTAAAVGDRVRRWFGSGAFTESRYPTSTPRWGHARVIALYRGALNREVEQSTLDRLGADLERGVTAWAAVVEGVVASVELRDVVTPQACGTDGSDRWPNYGFAATHRTPVPPQPAGTVGFLGKAAGQTQADLQALLRDPAVTVVDLAPQAVVELTAPLHVPSGKTLRTAGEPGPDRYALQARLVRVRNFEYAAVVACEFGDNALSQRGLVPGGCDGAHIRSVWVDGNRNGPNDAGGRVVFAINDANVYFLGGTNSSLERSRVSNTSGWTSVFVPGPGGGGWACGDIRVAGNLVDSYSAYHSWSVPGSSDGIGVTCHDVDVVDNHVVDASDVPLIMFLASYNDHRGVQNIPQRSQFVGNTVFQASNGVVGGIAFSGLANDYPTLAIDADFTGSLASGNLLWSSPTREAHFDFIVTIGARMWNFTPGAHPLVPVARPRDSHPVRGVTVVDNTSGSGSAVAQFEAAAAGAYDTRYLRNTFTQLATSPELMEACGPATRAVATYGGGWASFAATDVVWEDRSLLTPTGTGCASGSR